MTCGLPQEELLPPFQVTLPGFSALTFLQTEGLDYLGERNSRFRSPSIQPLLIEFLFFCALLPTSIPLVI